MIRVLVVDDSPTVRRVLTSLIAKSGDAQVIATAGDAWEAREHLVADRPDVMTLDVDMPRMDGLAFLAKVMQHQPMPVIILSSLTAEASAAALRAHALGAAAVLAKPAVAGDLVRLGDELTRTIRLCAGSRIRPRRTRGGTSSTLLPTIARTPIVLSGEPADAARSSLIALGASTGGTDAIAEVLRKFPADAPPTVLVQHMPPGFTTTFAKRLDDICAIRVHEAAEGELLRAGTAVLAPGGQHLVICRAGAHWQAHLSSEPPEHYQRPAVDVTFRSLATAAVGAVAAALLTGMGRDGASGLLALRQAGARTIAQDEATCVVYGMPRAAVELDAAETVLPLDHIAARLLKAARSAVAS